jgi:hypothetical protein
MTLQDLFDQATQDVPESRKKDIKTSVNVLAKALGYGSPGDCQSESFRLPPDRIAHILEQQLTGKGAHTIRNTKNNISRLYRLAEEKELYEALPKTTEQILAGREILTVGRPGGHMTKRDGSYLTYANWPTELQAAWQGYESWATDPFVEGRPARLRKRPVTVKLHRTCLESFFGYIHNELKQKPTFEDIQNTDYIAGFLRSRIKSRNNTVSTTIHRVLIAIAVITGQYLKKQDVRDAVKAIHKDLPKAQVRYNKQDAWPDGGLETLATVARSIWPTRQPEDFVTGGLQTAFYAGISLMLSLWCYIPYRQRNMREMKLDENLYKDARDNTMKIRFSGEQMKIETKNGHENVLEMPFPDDLLPKLNEYLTKWRPILAKRTDNAYSNVFLSKSGKPFDYQVLCSSIRSIVGSYTGKHFHPHMIRSIWATECITKQQEKGLYIASVMLNDKFETVAKNYLHLLDQDVAKQAYTWVNAQLGK